MSRKVAVVTGASRGLGRGIARAFGRCGFKVYVTGRTVDALEAVKGEIEANGGEGVIVSCDHSDDLQAKALFERIRVESGKLDILVNNAAQVNARELVASGGGEIT